MYPHGTSKWGFVAAVAATVALTLGSAACIPADEDVDHYGSLRFDYAPSDAVRDGLPATAFADGWSFTFHRVLLTTGSVSFSSQEGTVYTSCGSYATDDDGILFDAKVPYSFTYDKLRAKECKSLPVSLYAYNELGDTLGPGTTKADLAFMRQELAAAYYIEGVARRGSETKGVALRFPRGFDTMKCALVGGGTSSGSPSLSGLAIVEGVRQAVPMRFLAERIFRDSLAPEGTDDPGVLRFDAFANADSDPRFGNADGTVTLDELARVPLAELAGTAGAYAPAGQSIRRLDSFVRAQMEWGFGASGRCRSANPIVDRNEP